MFKLLELIVWNTTHFACRKDQALSFPVVRLKSDTFLVTSSWRMKGFLFIVLV